MILSSETNPSDAQAMLEFYKQNFAVVEIVRCNLCNNLLAFECYGGDPMGLPADERGKVIIPIGNNLLSSRVRLDEAATGEPMMGYQCGAPVPNPEYPKVMKQYELDLAEYEEGYQKKLKKAEAIRAKLPEDQDKNTVPLPEYNPPAKPLISETRECGNDTRLADIERGLVPVGKMQVSLSPFEKHQIREKIRADKKHKPVFRKVGNIKQYETFEVERV